MSQSVIGSASKNNATSSSILLNINLSESFEENQSLTNQLDQLTIDSDPIRALSSLILDQLNAQDTNAILEAQNHTLVWSKIMFLFDKKT